MGSRPLTNVDPTGRNWLVWGAVGGVFAYYTIKSCLDVSDAADSRKKALAAADTAKFFADQMNKCVTQGNCSPDLARYYGEMANRATADYNKFLQEGATGIAGAMPGTSVTGPLPASRWDAITNGIQGIITNLPPASAPSGSK